LKSSATVELKVAVSQSIPWKQNSLSLPDVFVTLDSRDSQEFESIILSLGLSQGFYAGTCLLVSGEVIGTLSISDPRPRSEFPLSERMMLLNLGILVSNELVLQRNQELRYREKVLRSFRLKHYVDVSLKNLHHNLRTPLATLTLAIQNLLSDYQKETAKEESSASQMKLALHHLEKYSLHVEKVIALCLRTACLLPFLTTAGPQTKSTPVADLSLLSLSEEIPSYTPPRSLSSHGHSSLHPGTEALPIAGTVQRLKDLVEFMNLIDASRPSLSVLCSPLGDRAKGFQLNFQIGATLERCLATESTPPRLVPKSFPQLLLAGTISKLCQCIETVCESRLPTVISMSLELYESTAHEGCPLPITLRDQGSIGGSGAQHSVVVVCLRGKVSESLTFEDLEQRQLAQDFDFASLDRTAEMVGGGSTVQIIRSAPSGDSDREMEFLFWLPCQIGVDSELSPSVSLSETAVAGAEVKTRPAGLRVLLIDDSPHILRSLGDYLSRQESCDVTLARNGIVGLEMIIDSIQSNAEQGTGSNLTLRSSFDVIIVDCLMPCKCGVELMMDLQQWLLSQGQPPEDTVFPGPPSLSLLPETLFVALLAPCSDFDEMIPDEFLGMEGLGEGETPSCLSPETYGFGEVLAKPLQLVQISELIQRKRDPRVE
jgi:CheY-like chemotaxis protein